MPTRTRWPDDAGLLSSGSIVTVMPRYSNGSTPDHRTMPPALELNVPMAPSSAPAVSSSGY